MSKSKYNITLSFNAGLAKDVGVIPALVFDELSFWSDKGNRKDGWVYKSYEEMTDRLPLSEYQIRQSYKLLKKLGFIETKIMKVDNSTVLHYRILKNLTLGTEKTSLPMGTKETSVPSIYTATHQQLTGAEAPDTDINQNEPEPQKSSAIPSKDARKAFDALVPILHPDMTILSTRGRMIKLKQRLGVFSKDDLVLAAKNLMASPWHTGDNPGNKKFASLDFLIRNDEQVEKWMNEKPVKKTRTAF